MIKYIIASENDIDLLMQSRLEMLKVVNDLPDDYTFSDDLIVNRIKYFKNANQLF